MANRISQFRCWLPWFRDFLTDPRVFLKVRKTREISDFRRSFLNEWPVQSSNHQPRLAITFDIERDLGQVFESAASETASPFLKMFPKESAVKATWFVQGALVESLATDLEPLISTGNLVGLHGFMHELWGTNNWITRRPPISVSERRRRLEMSLEKFVKVSLPKPFVFRAPNFTIDMYTYRLLSEYGFTIDSSVPSQRGNMFEIRNIGGITVLPVSVAPIPVEHSNPILKMVTAMRYFQFNFDVIMKTSLSDLERLVGETLAFQSAIGIRPHLMTYAHNWEFFRGEPFLREYFSRINYLIHTFSFRPVELVSLQRYLTEEIHG